MTMWSGWFLHAEPMFCLQMVAPFASKKRKKKVTNYEGLLISSVRKVDVLLAASLEGKMLWKKRKKMAGGEEEKIW